jgi:hypothetical protein
MNGLGSFLLSERGVQAAGLALSLLLVVAGLVLARLLWRRRPGE